MKKRLITLASLLLLVSSCSESDYTSPLSPSVDKETTIESRAAYSWSDTFVGYSFYSEDTPATSYFTGTGVPFYGTSITNVSWSYNNPPSGNFSSVILQYSRPYSAYPSKFWDITNEPNGFTDQFNGESAKGQISIKFVSENGNYPLRRTLADTVIVNYSK